MKVTRKTRIDMKIRSKERKEYSEDVEKRSYESKKDGRYETANKEEGEKLITLGNFLSLP